MYKMAFGISSVVFTLMVSCGPASAGTAAPVVAAAPADAVVINEILAHTDPPQQDSVELYNTADTAIELSGWILSDDKQAEQRYVIAPQTVLAAGGYLVVTLEETAPFRLSEFGETLYLFQPGEGDAVGPLVASATFGVSPNGVSFGPLTLSTGAMRQVLLQDVTLGEPNTPPRVGPLVIDEVMYRPADDLGEYVSIVNAGSTPTPLCAEFGAGSLLPAVLRVDDEIVFELPCGMLLEPGSRLLIAGTRPDELRRQYAIDGDTVVLGPFTGRLSNEGEPIDLAWPQPPELDGTIAYYALDALDYLPGAPWPMLAAPGQVLLRRDLTTFGDDPANWRAGASSFAAQRVWLPVVDG